MVIIDSETVRRPAKLVEALSKHRVTHLISVPTLLELLVPHLLGEAAFHPCSDFTACAIPVVPGVPYPRTKLLI